MSFELDCLNKPSFKDCGQDVVIATPISRGCKMNLGFDVDQPCPIVMLDVGFALGYVGMVSDQCNTSPFGHFSMKFGTGLVNYLYNPHALTLIG